MKFRILFVLLTLVVFGFQGSRAYAIVCNNSTIRGSYAFTIHGTVLLPDGSSLLIDGLAKTNFDGYGNIVQLDAVAANGSVAPGWRSSTGTYSVNPDCTATFTVSNGDQPPIHAQFVVAQSGNTIHAMVIDLGFAVTSEAERVRALEE